jgi:hypothetical protein
MIPSGAGGVSMRRIRSRAILPVNFLSPAIMTSAAICSWPVKFPHDFFVKEHEKRFKKFGGRNR